MSAPELRDGERIDDLDAGGLRLIQRADGFRFGTDSVLLSDFAAPKKRDRVCELGCGTGAVCTLMAYYHPEITVDAVELQPEVADMARRSVIMNDMTERIRVHEMDMRDARKVLGAQSMTLVVCNPPYGRVGSGAESPGEARRISRQAGDLTPEILAESASGLLRSGGRFCVVYPAERLAELITAFGGARLAPKRIRCVHTVEGHPPKLVLLEGVRDGGPGLKWLPPLVLMDSRHRYTDEWRRIYHMDADAGNANDAGTLQNHT